MSGIMKEVSYIAAAIVGLAIIAVLVSNNAKTAEVIKAAGGAFSGALQAATNPFSGNFGSNAY